MRKIIIPSVLLVIAMFGVPSCAPTVSQPEYDRVSNELSAAQSQLELLQGKLAEAESLQANYEELSKQHVIAESERETVQTK
jgi:multidrug resistance efflux pump